MVRKKVLAVQSIFRDLERKSNAFKNKANLKCLSNCSACCLSKNIEATALEFLPLAYRLLKESNMDHLLSKLDDYENEICIFYSPLQESGGCAIYEDRGLICRLFGFSAKLNKHDKPQLVACKEIKEPVDPDILHRHLPRAPLINEYNMRLYAVDPWLAAIRYPINTAIHKAVDYVYLHTQFRTPGKAC